MRRGRLRRGEERRAMAPRSGPGGGTGTGLTSKVTVPINVALDEPIEVKAPEMP
jgi:hypothetical protein